MGRCLFILKPVLVLSLLLIPGGAANGQSGSTSFSRDGLSFSYPADWSLVDKSDPEAQQLHVTKPGSSEVIVVYQLKRPLSPGPELRIESRRFTESYIDRLAERFEKPRREFQCTEVGTMTVAGAVIRGVYHAQPAAFEVYAFIKGGRFFQIVYLRADKDAESGDPVWARLRASLAIEDVVKAYSDPVLDIISGGELNGKAKRLPAPDYPAIARRAHASGAVVVQVLIDEQGKVVWAEALSGHPLLQGSAVQAAKAATFTGTTVCGRGVRVYGRVIYNFIAM